MKKIFTSFLFAALMLVASSAKAQFSYDLVDDPRTGWCDGPDVVFSLSEVAAQMEITPQRLYDYWAAWTAAAGGNTNGYECNGFFGLENQATAPSYHSEQYGGFEMDVDGNFAWWNGSAKWGVYIRSMSVENDQLVFCICQNPTNAILKGEVCKGEISLNLDGGKATFSFTVKIKTLDDIDKEPVLDFTQLEIVGEATDTIVQEPNSNWSQWQYIVKVPNIATLLDIDPEYMDAQFKNMIFAKQYDFVDDKWGELTNKGDAVPAPGFYFAGGIYPEGEETEIAEVRNAKYGSDNLFYICGLSIFPISGELHFLSGQYPGAMKDGDSRNADLYIVYGDKAYIVHVVFQVKNPEQVRATDLTKVGETTWELTSRDPRGTWLSLDYYDLDTTAIKSAFSAQLGREVELSEIKFMATNQYGGLDAGYTADNSETAVGFWMSQANTISSYSTSGANYYIDYLPLAGQLAVGNKPNVYAGGERFGGIFYLVVEDCYYQCNLAATVMSPEYTFETCEEIDYDLNVRLVPSSSSWEIGQTSTLDIDEILNTGDPKLYGVAADGSYTTAYSVSEANNGTTGGGFWMTAKDENDTAYAGWYTGDGAFAMWYYNGTIHWFAIPGLPQVGETVNATFYVCNFWDGKKVKLNTTIKFVDHITTILPLGEEDLVLNARDEAGSEFDEATVNFDAACAALGCTEEQLLESGVWYALDAAGDLTSEGFDDLYGFAFTADGVATTNADEAAFQAGIISADGVAHSYVVNDEDVDKVFKTTIYLSYNNKLYAYNITIGDEATAITNIAATSKSSKTYDLSGREVRNPAKGLYIRNGKKFMVK